MEYNRYWVKEWDRIKLSKRSFDFIIELPELIYILLRHYTIGVFGFILSSSFYYYAIVIERATGILMIYIFVGSIFIMILSVNYSIRRNIHY